MRTLLILGPACSMVLVACHADGLAVARPASAESGVAGHVGTSVPGMAFYPASPGSPQGTALATSAGLSRTELKYRLLERFPNPFFCDPDQYPVARSDETELARRRFGELQADPEQLRAILRHNGLVGSGPFSDGEVLRIDRDRKRLGAIHLDPSGEGYRFELGVLEGKAQGFIIKGWVDPGGTVTVKNRLPSSLSCPVCLPSETRIDTPRGPVPIADLQVGDPVWTLDEVGNRREAIIVKTARVPVPAGHRMVDLRLEDGRALRASPGHPTADGRRMEDLRVGDTVDGARVARIGVDAEAAAATYDLLPSGSTGYYWANGIRIGSTLSPGLGSR
jgi:hypothetical protein